MMGDPQAAQTADAPPAPSSESRDGSSGGLTAHHHKWVHDTLGINPLDYVDQPDQPTGPTADQSNQVGVTAPSEPSSGSPVSAPAEVSAEAPNAAASPKDKYKGVIVSNVTISLARKRVGFQTSLGMMLGDVDTDLQPGDYTLQPDLPNQKWIITGPGVKSGLRFTVNLKDADPWILAYPKTLPLSVTAGSDKEPKTAGDMQDPTGKQKDPLWLYEGMPLKEPISGPDDFEDIHYDLDYRSDKGNLSKFLQVNYRDNSHKDIDIDKINNDTPRLWAAKQDVLKIMDNYNTTFILGSFPTVFFIITINPFVAPIEGGPAPRYSATRRSAPKGAPTTETSEPGNVANPDEPGTPQEAPPAATATPPAGPAPQWPAGVEKANVNRVLIGKDPLESLTPEQREAAAAFYEQTANRVVGERATEAAALNRARAAYLRGQTSTVPGRLPPRSP